MIPSHKTIAPLTFYILFLSENEEKRNETVIKSSEEKKSTCIWACFASRVQWQLETYRQLHQSPVDSAASCHLPQ